MKTYQNVMGIKQCKTAFSAQTLSAVVLGCLFVFMCQGWSAIYYVSSSNGDDQNSGLSVSAPWRTLAKVSAMEFQPEDVILLKSGDKWNESLVLKGNGEPERPITLSMYGKGERPRISSGEDQDRPAVQLTNPRHWIIESLELYDSPAGLRVPFTEYGNRDLVVRDLKVHGCSEIGIEISVMSGEMRFKNACTDVLLEDCEIYDCNMGAALRNATNATIRRLKVYQCGPGNGINFTRNTGGRISECLFRNNGGQHEENSPGHTDLMLIHCLDVVVEANVFEGRKRGPNDRDGCGFDFEGGNCNVVVRGNTFERSDGHAILVFNGPRKGSAGPNRNCVIEANEFIESAANPWKESQRCDIYVHSFTGRDTIEVRNNRSRLRPGRSFIGGESVPGIRASGNEVVNAGGSSPEPSGRPSKR